MLSWIVVVLAQWNNISRVDRLFRRNTGCLAKRQIYSLDLTQPGLAPTIYRTREDADHYTADAVKLRLTRQSKINYMPSDRNTIIILIKIKR